MKKFPFFMLISFLVLVSCSKKDNYDYYNLATPVLMSLAEVRTAIDVLPPKEITESGKIYSYNNYIFVNDKNKGVHIINNSNPESPHKISFLNIPGNVDISIKNERLFANSFVDLVVFDISNINNIKKVNLLENVFYFYYQIPEGADAINWEEMQTQDGFPVDWVITREKRKFDYENVDFISVAAAENLPSTTGTGGSLARFKIVDEYLYSVDSHNINIFNIEDLENPNQLESVFAGFDIETIFNRGNHLFLGSMSGMYIYDISTPSVPKFISEFQHGTACDPVIVDNNYAYITLRSGNSCGAFESSLQIVDITDIENPVLEKSYAMDQPYGIGIKDEKLFICDGDSGLKVYDKTDITNLKLLNHFKNINTFDVIPLETNLLMIGDGILYQYTYENSVINLLSTFSLN